MKAAVIDSYGPPDVVRIAEVPRPEPKRGQVLVRVVATAVTAGDARIRGARFPRGFAPLARLALGLRRPRRPILGVVLSGVVEAAGPGAHRFRPGDEVCGMTGAALGAHAEFAAVSERRLAPKPGGVSHADAAAALFGGTTALHFLRDRAALTPGRTVLVNGASGAVGTSAVQLAKHLGAHVTAVTSARNAELVVGLGADRVIDYTSTPLEQLGERFDVVLDAVGNLPRASGMRLLTERGVLLLVVADLWDMVRARGRVKAGRPAPERAEDIEYLLGLVASGVLRPVVRELGGLGAIVDAYRLVDSGHKVGNLIVDVAPSGT